MATTENLDRLVGTRVTYRINAPRSFEAPGVLKTQEGRPGYYDVDVGGDSLSFHKDDIVVNFDVITNVS